MFRILLHTLRKYFGSRVIIYGMHSSDWRAALAADAPVWLGLKQVGQVVLVEQADGSLPVTIYRLSRTVIIPLMEDHIINCPDKYPRLIPSRQAVQILRNKAVFADYVAANNLIQFCPENYWSSDDATFPCVLKRVDLNASAGIAIVDSAKHLSELLTHELWLDQPFLLQEFIYGTEYVTHCVLKSGKILWHCSYRYADSICSIRRGAPCAESIQASQQILAEIELFLMPLFYSGPCNVDYKISDQGHILVMEINPRFGGSLLTPNHLQDLQAALSCVIREALS